MIIYLLKVVIHLIGILDGIWFGYVGIFDIIHKALFHYFLYFVFEFDWTIIYSAFLENINKHIHIVLYV